MYNYIFTIQKTFADMKLHLKLFSNVQLCFNIFKKKFADIVVHLSTKVTFTDV
jgi:hypothetical protein